MASLLESNLEATKLMLRMRTLINLEFNILLNFTHNEIESQLCMYGFKSQSPELHAKAKQLATLATIALPDTEKNSNNLLELLASDKLTTPVQISAAGISTFVVDKANNRFWSASSLKHFNNLDGVDVNLINIKPLSHKDMKNLEQKQHLFQPSETQAILMKPTPLEEFFWFVSTRFNQDQPLNGLSILKRVRLTHWPEIFRQSDYRAYARMAAQLMQHPSSVPEFIRAQGSATEIEAIIFLNACYLCGWLIESQEPLKVKQDDINQKRKLNFISRIRAKLGIGKQ